MNTQHVAATADLSPMRDCAPETVAAILANASTRIIIDDATGADAIRAAEPSIAATVGPLVFTSVCHDGAMEIHERLRRFS